MNEKTILFITREIVPFFYGGIGTLFMSVAKLANLDGHDVHFLTQEQEHFDYQIYDQYYGNIPIHFVNNQNDSEFVDLSPTGGVVNTSCLAYSFAVADAYKKVSDEIEPDIVFSADFGAETFILLLQKTLGEFSRTQFIVHLSGALTEILGTYREGIKNCIYNELNEPRNQLVCSMENSCMYLADKIIAPSRIAWEHVHSRLGLDESKLEVIPNLLDQKFINSLSDHAYNEYEKEGKIILFIGRLDHLKGADIVLGLFLKYLENYKDDSRLIMIGRDCFCKAYGRTFLEEWEVKIPDPYKDRVTFTGQIDHGEVKKYLHRATICIFPSRLEVFGIVCLEAMAYGVPALVSEGTGLRELLGEGLKDNCFNFTSDKDEVLRYLHQLLSDQNRRQLLGKLFIERAEEIKNQGERGYQQLFDQFNVHRVEKVSPGATTNIMTILKVMSQITGFIGKDFLKLKEYYKASDEDVKSIVHSGKRESGTLYQKLKSIIK